jgi:hypothetical protein|tara:strand:- start:691 stop:819 length:129 start_codon:yes stop_codon:yes gene_type:complete
MNKTQKENKYSNPMWTKEEQEAVDKYVERIRFKPKNKEEKEE